MEIVFIVLVFLAIAFFIKAIRIVKQAEVMVIERLGSYNRTLTSGPNFVIPFFDQAREIEWKYSRDVGGRSVSYMQLLDRIDLRETVYDFPSQAVITKWYAGKNPKNSFPRDRSPDRIVIFSQIWNLCDNGLTNGCNSLKISSLFYKTAGCAVGSVKV